MTITQTKNSTDVILVIQKDSELFTNVGLTKLTYVLDSHFPSFVRNHWDLFPEYFLEAIRSREEAADIEK